MNFIDACGVLADSTELMTNDKLAHEAREIVRAVVNAYDALEPSVEIWPKGATHYVINADSSAEWLFGVSSERQLDISGSKWSKRHVWASEPVGYVDIPPGIDWRQCIWQRPNSL